MFKVGDEVYVKAQVVDTDAKTFEGYNHKVQFLDSINNEWDWVSESAISDKTYTQGLADAWELAKKIYSMETDAIKEIFGVTGSLWSVLRELTAEEALAKIEAYEKEKSEIKVGDVVECNGFKGVVLHIFHSGSLNIVYENGIIDTLASVQECEKTGKHIEIESLLKQIGE